VEAKSTQTPAGKGRVLRLGTRGSVLAMAQSRWVAAELERCWPGIGVELRPVATSGDALGDRSLGEMGGKGLFTKELEQALVAGELDVAVHSLKDVPVTMPLVAQEELVIEAIPRREDVRDVLVSLRARSLAQLPRGARVGTSSLRRRCQLLAARPDLRIEPLRGNIDTRLRRLREGQWDAVVVAMAGLRRSGLFDAGWMVPLEPQEMLPAPGQGALAVQCRREDQATRRLLAPLNDRETAVCVQAERRLVELLQGDCRSPIAALAMEEGGMLSLIGAVGGRDGDPPVLKARARAAEGEAAAMEVYGLLKQQEAESSGRE